MDGGGTAALGGASELTLETAKRRCVSLLEALPLLTETAVPSSSSTTLSRLINSELSFLRRLSAAEISSRSSLSLNIGHLEAVVHVLFQPFVTAVSRICRPVRVSSSEDVYVDIVCSVQGDPVWVTVSDRNPRYIAWEGDDAKKGLKQKILNLVGAAGNSPLMLRPSWILMFFSFGADGDVHQKLQSEFGAVELEMEDQWSNLVLGRIFQNACVFKIEVCRDGSRIDGTGTTSRRMDALGSCRRFDEHMDLDLGSSFCSLISALKCWCCSLDDEVESSALVNFDMTAMVAVVSGISSTGTGRLLSTPEGELRARFKGNLEFVIAQAKSEYEKPILNEISGAVSGKRGIVCESVVSEFKEIIAMYGGPNERRRAEFILKFIKLVPDTPSTRVMSLPTTRKMTLKNKVVFGTGDLWHALTLTANMAFVRAVRQTGVSLSVIEHRPRALIGE